MQWFFLSDTQEQVPVSEEQMASLVQTGVIRSNTMIWREGMPQWVSCSEVKPELFAQPQAQSQPLRAAPVIGAAATARHQTAPVGYAPQPQPQPHPHPHPQAVGARTAMVHGGPEVGLVREAATVFGEGAGWMKFLGVLAQIFGVLTLFGVLFLLVTGGMLGSGAAFIGIAIGALFNAVAGGIMLWQGILLFQSASKTQEALRTGQKHSLMGSLASCAKFFKIWGIMALIGVVLYVGIGVVIVGAGGVAALMAPEFDPASWI